jgi:hypothetical protein
MELGDRLASGIVGTEEGTDRPGKCRRIGGHNQSAPVWRT